MNPNNKISLQQPLAARDTHSFSNLRALVVDDDRLIRSIVPEMLKKMGFQVDIAEGGGSAISALKLCRYDLVLTDYLMPEIDGSALAKWVKQHDENACVTMMTGCDTSEVQHFLEFGLVDALLFKPLNFSYLRETLQEVIEEKRNQNSFSVSGK